MEISKKIKRKTRTVLYKNTIQKITFCQFFTSHPRFCVKKIIKKINFEPRRNRRKIDVFLAKTSRESEKSGQKSTLQNSTTAYIFATKIVKKHRFFNFKSARPKNASSTTTRKI
jgi:hypothetical protein